MAEHRNSLNCQNFVAQTDRPEPVVSKNECSSCAGLRDNCPKCRDQPAQNRATLDVVAISQRQSTTSDDCGNDVPEISIDYVKITAPTQAFALGTFADLYDAVWQKQSVALKVLRGQANDPGVLKDVLHEARLAMSLNHPNVVRVFGIVSISNSKGILMEKASHNSLREALNATKKLSQSQQVLISIDIVDGLEHIHSKQMIHRDLKPENILLFDIKSRLTAKIADFGISKVVQSSLASTAMVGTMYYMAPELFEPKARYGCEVDVYSVAIVLYEVFSGRTIRDAYGGIVNPMMLLKGVAGGQRPKIPELFPAELRTVVERGWSANAKDRPTMADFREVLCSLKESTRNVNPTANAITSTNDDMYAVFEAQLQKVEQSTKAYNLKDARSRVEVCRRMWMDLRRQTTTTTSTARFHSVKGYIHHWFGECSDAYKETYQALSELHELCSSGTSVDGEQVVTILRHAVAVCWSQDQYAAAVLLVSYAARYAKSKLSIAAYADVLECFGFIGFYGDQWSKIAEFVLLARLQVSDDIPHINVATAYYYMARTLSIKQSNLAALQYLEQAQQVINDVDANNIWGALCKSWKAHVIRESTNDQKKYEESKQILEDALRIAEGVLGINNETVSDIYRRLAVTLQRMKRLNEAEVMYKKAIAAAENSLGPNSMLLSNALKWLADMYNNQLNKYQEAEALYLQSIYIRKRVRGPGYQWLSHLYKSIANTYAKLGQSDEAASYLQLKSEVDSGKLEDKSKSTFEALEKLVDEVSTTLESDNQLSVAPGELVDVLREFFEVAPKPQSQPLYQNSAAVIN